MSSGIYKIENIQNHKVYIGRSKNIEVRWKQHLLDLENHCHHSFKLQNEYDNAADKTIFQFSIIEEITTIKQLKKREQYYINFYQAASIGYNLCPFADNPKYIKNASSDPKLLINSKNDMNDKYVMIPREIIEMKDLDIKRMPVYTYLCKNRTLSDEVNLSLNNIVHKCGYRNNRNNGKINSQMITILDTLENLGYFKLIEGKYSGDKFCILEINPEKFDIPNSFACISFKELDLMFNSKSNKNNTTYSNLILLLSYIRVNKLRRSENQQWHPERKPEFFYRQIKTISKDIGISERNISKCINVLNDLNIIVSKPMPRYKDKYDNWHTDVTLFVDKFDGWENELKWGEEFLLTNKSLAKEDNQY